VLYNAPSLKCSGMTHVQQRDHTVLPATHTWTISAFTPQLQGVTTLWLVLTVATVEGMARPSWPRCPVTYRYKCPAPVIEHGYLTHPSTNRAQCRLTSLIKTMCRNLVVACYGHLQGEKRTWQPVSLCRDVITTSLRYELFEKLPVTTSRTDKYSTWQTACLPVSAISFFRFSPPTPRNRDLFKTGTSSFSMIGRFSLRSVLGRLSVAFMMSIIRALASEQNKLATEQLNLCSEWLHTNYKLRYRRD